MHTDKYIIILNIYLKNLTIEIINRDNNLKKIETN